MTALPVRPAHELTLLSAEQRWLIEGLWGAEAVGIVGGEPKCCKSFLALDMAVAVASATPCLRRFPVARPGRVLLFAAEDALSTVRQRLDGICAAVDRCLVDLDLQVITAPTLRLDLDLDRNRLDDTVRALRPTLLILDPFVRLHRIDENVSADVAPLLDYLRGLQRRYQTAVVLVHHARKGAAHLRAGQALRGSSELHAWGDSNLYLRRTGTADGLTLTIEHRAAASSEGLALHLSASGDGLALQLDDPLVADPVHAPPPSALDRIEALLAEAAVPLSLKALRSAAKMRAATVSDALAALVTQGRARRSDKGYLLIAR
jgi:RecA-family ATPase